MYYFYGKSNRGHGHYALYRGCPPFGESVIRGFTVFELEILPCSQLFRCRMLQFAIL